jgi:hypothetical protein
MTYHATLTEANGANHEAWETTMDEIAEANPDESAMLSEIASLPIGQKAAFGGGAQPIFTFTRLT